MQLSHREDLAMPEIETRNESVRRLRGLHLYHDYLSSCAQRVRIVLGEKGLPWTSHVVDLSKMEHATPEYQSINPSGLVPTLVHDGRTYVESVDIIQYVDELAPTPSLAPAAGADRPAFDTLLAAADGAQVALKTLTHEFLFRGSGRYLAQGDREKFAAAHQNAWLVEFKRLYAEGGPPWQAKVTAALNETDGHFRRLDERLAASRWLVGDRFTLADVPGRRTCTACG
jgi:glutathione S-transferase